MSEAVGFKLPTPEFAIIRSAFTRLCSSELFRLRVWRKWLPAETWAAALTISGLIDENVCTVDAMKFNAAIIRRKLHFDGSSMDRFDGTNHSGVFHVTFQQKLYYMVTDPFEQVKYPHPLNTQWKDRVVTIALDVLSVGVKTRSSTTSLFSFEKAREALENTTLDEFLSSCSTMQKCTLDQEGSFYK